MHPYVHHHPRRRHLPGSPPTSRLLHLLRTVIGVALLGVAVMGYASSSPAAAQDDAALWAALVKTKGYVVGSPLASSGLHRFDGDTTWSHVGWNIPRVSGISSDPHDSDVVFLAAGNGVLRTLDGGATWTLVTGWEVTEAQDISVDPHAPENVYVATAYGVWHTSDAGDHWVETTASLPEKYTQAVAVDRTQRGRVLIGTWGGLYVSDDAGKSWNLAAADGTPVLDIKQSMTESDTWIAATHDHGVMLSDDGGRTWRVADAVPDEHSVLAVAVDPFDATTMAAGGWGGVFLSTDGGRRWDRRTEGLPVSETYEVVFDANEPGRLWAAPVESGMYYSDDAGTTWQYAGLNGALVFDMTFIQPTPE